MFCGFDYLCIFGLKCKECGYVWVSQNQFKKLSFMVPNNYTENCKVCGTKTNIGIKWKDYNIKDIYKYMGFSSDIFDKATNLEPYSPLILDESVNFAMGEDWMHSKNKVIKRLFTQFRTKHLIIFMNIPKFSWLQSKYRDDLATAWFRIVKRNLCLMLVPDLGEGQDSYHLKDFEDMLGSYTYSTSTNILLQRVKKLRSKHPCLYDYFYVPKVPKKFYKEYLKLRDYFVYKREDADKENNLHKLILFNLKYRWMSFRQACRSLKHPSATLIADILTYDPSRKTSLCSKKQVYDYIKSMREIIDNKLNEQSIKK
jgi:hypothetical protein